MLRSCLSLSARTSVRLSLAPLRVYSRSNTDPSIRHVLVPIANGTEEIEAVTIIDVLVRGGANVCVASVESTLQVVCSRGVKLSADVLISDATAHDWDLVVIPGGMPGATHLRKSPAVCDILARQMSQGRSIGAICAAPAVVLADLGLLLGKSATCYPAPKFRQTLLNESNNDVVVDGNVITSQGPGTAMAFAVKLVDVLFGEEKAKAIAKELLFKF